MSLNYLNYHGMLYLQALMSDESEGLIIYVDDAVNTAKAELNENIDTAKEEVREELNENINEAVEEIVTYTFYAYAEDTSGDGFSISDTELQYRGIAVSVNDEQPMEPENYEWAINPRWASRYASDFISPQSDGIKIVSPEVDTYAVMNALALAFYLSGIEQARFGYDISREAYGLVAQNIFAFGSGAGVKFDNSPEAAVRGRFVWEIRENGHLSLKKY